jgi:hypothetical protein
MVKMRLCQPIPITPALIIVVFEKNKKPASFLTGLG